MFKMRIALVLMAVTLSITGLNGQENRSISQEIKEAVIEVKTEMNNLQVQLERPTRIVVTKNRKLRNVPLTRRGKRISNRSGFWNRNWALDRYYPRRGTDNFVNVYVGLNNWLLDGEDLPNSDELFSLSPINSWYLGLNFDNISKIAGPIYLDWGIGIGIQNFAFENTRVRVSREAVGDPSAITFTELADISGRVSKLNVTYLNVHLVPTFSFGRYNGFRVGFGVYGGYRIGSNARTKFDDLNGDKQKDRIKDSFHINPFKYGFRAQLGWDFFDLFATYDLTDFFDEDVAAPRLTPITLGVIF